MRLKKSLVYLSLILTTLLWGLNVVAIKFLVSGGRPLSITSIRLLLAGLLLGAIVIFSGNWKKLSWRQFRLLLACSFFGTFLHHFFLALGLSKTTAVNGSLILALDPLATTLIAFLVLGDRITLIRLSGIILGLIGVLAIFLTDLMPFNLVIGIGDVLIILAMIFQSIAYVLIKLVVETVQVTQVTMIAVLCGGLGLLPVAYFLEGSVPFTAIMDFSPSLWLLLLSSAWIAISLGNMLWNNGIRHLGPGQTVIFSNMIPLYGMLGSMLFLHEAVRWSHLVGAFLIITGVLLGSGLLGQREVEKAGGRSIEAGAGNLLYSEKR
jgi:drug/metabolite transporter (DMT)-like permease